MVQYSAERANPQPEVCNVLGDSITLRLTAEQTDGKYKDLNDMAKVVEIVTKEGVNIAG